jgi:tRNA nucleotidyltransferase (CCA-adding enzyme)
MARRGHAYPQVDPRAESLGDGRVVRAPASATVAAALGAARRRDAAVVALGTPVSAWVLRQDLAHASALGLDALEAASLARALPAVNEHTAEVTVRRHLLAGAPLVIVTDRRGPVGAVTSGLAPEARPAPSLRGRIVERLPEVLRERLRVVGQASTVVGARAWAVGGLVRDVLLDTSWRSGDVDVVVEGDAVAVARGVAARLGGTVVEHTRFLTASVQLTAGGRIDVATARAERYEARGELPHVVAASIAQDLGRRDFTVNAMAIELGSGDFALLDPFDGRGDVARRRLRVLHPLSFVDDPTRIFRAARYASRLGFTEDAFTRHARDLALSLGDYPALSGQRMVAELELIVADARPAAALRRLAGAGVLRLLDPRYRFTRPTAQRLGALPPTLAWIRARRLPAHDVDLALAVLLADQPAAVRRAALARLVVAGERAARVELAVETSQIGTLAAVQPASEAARRLREAPPLLLAWWWLVGDAGVRERIDWFLTTGRLVQPALRGDDLAGLGVPRGPALATVLGELRDARLDGLINDRDGEVGHVLHWLNAAKEG